MKTLLAPDAAALAAMTPEEKAAAAAATASSIAALVGTFAGLAAPQFLPLIAGFTVLIKHAPSLYLDVLLLFSKGDPTPEQKADFAAKLSVLLNPEKAYEDKPPVNPS